MQFNFKKIISNKLFLMIVSFVVLLAGILTFIFVKGQKDSNDWVISSNGKQISFSEYLLLISTSVEEVEKKIQKPKYGMASKMSCEDFKDADVDGTPSIQYLNDVVTDKMKKILVKEIAAEKLHVTLSEEEKKQLYQTATKYFKTYNNQFKAYDIGISFEDCLRYSYWELLDKKLADFLYGPGKPQEVTEKEIEDYSQNKEKVAREQMLKLPKQLLTLKEKKEEKKQQDKEENNEEEDEKKELLIKKHYKVEKLKDLAEIFSKKVNKENLTLEDVKNEIVEVFGNVMEGEVLTDEIKTLKVDEKEEQEMDGFGGENKKDLDEKKAKEFAAMKVGDCKVLELGEDVYIIKRGEVDEEAIKKGSPTVKGYIQEEKMENFLKPIREDVFSENTEVNDFNLNLKNSEKQIKKFFKNRQQEGNNSPFPAFPGFGGFW